jgi:hypothetical protein
MIASERIDTVVLPGDVVGELTTTEQEQPTQQQKRAALRIGTGLAPRRTRICIDSEILNL